MGGQLRLVPATPADPLAKIMGGYGGGVNTIAWLVWMWRHDYRPDAILMCDPGDEWQHTLDYRDKIMPEWLDRVGFPQITVTDRKTEGQFRARAWRLETLREECLRIKALPSTAYGWSKCSQKYKGETSRWWVARQAWAQAEWAAGRRILKVIGYDASEGYRVKDAFQSNWENERFVPWYPLYEDGLDRDDCIKLIRSAGLPVPGEYKGDGMIVGSACTYCPNATLDEWRLLRKVQPDKFAEAVEMSRAAEPELAAPDTVGLMRCNPHGKRQLHRWADGEYGDLDGDAVENPIPCDCAG